MTHGYSLRPNAKGRRGRQSTDSPDGQVEGSSDGTICSTDGGHDLADESGADDPGPATPRAAHTPVTAQTSTNHQRHHRHHMDLGGFTTRSALTETWEDIQAGRKREEARRCAEATRIRREQIVRGYGEEIRAVRARIVALREECEAEVARVRRKWERDHAVGRGGVQVVGEDGEVMVDSDSDSGADGEMEVENNNAHTETSFTTDNDDDGRWQQQQQRWPSQSPRRSRRSETHFPPPLQTGSRKTQQQPPHMDEISSPSGMAGPSRLESGVMEEESGEARSPPRRIRGQPQPLRRQRAQLMVVTASSLSSHTYATAVLGPENRSCGTDGDNDSEMGECL